MSQHEGQSKLLKFGKEKPAECKKSNTLWKWVPWQLQEPEVLPEKNPLNYCYGLNVCAPPPTPHPQIHVLKP